MMLCLIAFLFILLTSILASQLQSQVILTPNHDPYSFNIESAKSNAAAIFNTIHSSMRQWGSSVQHNGMSFFPATVPAGTLLYHGTVRDPRPVTGLEWLAFEIQHAEYFATPRRRCWHPIQPPPPTAPHIRSSRWSLLLEQTRMSKLEEDGDGDSDCEWLSGYLQIYQATRPLRLLYLDGMSAANCGRGTMDAQDMILMDNTTNFHQDLKKAIGLCDRGKEWGIDGIIRMETGFEVIMCNFSSSVEMLSSHRKPKKFGDEDEGSATLYEYVREAAQRYGGIDSSRVKIEYSNMVSAFFYPTNLTNPIPGNRDPRLVYADPAQLLRIKNDLASILHTRDEKSSIDWQGRVVDMITARFSDRLQLLATRPPQKLFLGTTNTLLNLYVNYNATIPPIEESIETCAMHFLLPVMPHLKTAQDRLIYAAIKTVTTRICSTLFSARSLLIESFHSRTSPSTSVSSAHKLITELIYYLNWPDWKLCPKCAIDEVCFIAMFPWGEEEDHYHPRCTTMEQLEGQRGGWGDGKKNYWWYGWGGT
ncbi:hypothetical protein B0O99DRAFT_251013 [Bisporella sp. PMI_857]|nr:hypothetical protein B0O99DRAFT_251013 [Bisporella sp. PMI_857]